MNYSEQCQICFNDKSSPFLNHECVPSCKKCITEYVVHQIERKEKNLKCFCGKEIGTDFLGSLEPSLIKKRDDLAKKLELIETKRYYYCPKISCSFEGELKDPENIQCEKCNTKICSKCKEELHSGPCKEWVLPNCKKCVVCEIPISKMDGCNKINCYNCGGIWCWDCETVVKDNVCKCSRKRKRKQVSSNSESNNKTRKFETTENKEILVTIPTCSYLVMLYDVFSFRRQMYRLEHLLSGLKPEDFKVPAELAEEYANNILNALKSSDKVDGMAYSKIEKKQYNSFLKIQIAWSKMNNTAS